MPDYIVPRQRAFLRLITAKPNLAKYVKALTWSLVWRNFEDCALTEIDCQTWNVFSRLTSVTRLDLASLHEIHDEDLVRQNPVQLFPAVTDLRLGGWMHRRLIKAILASLCPNRLQSLKLDYLHDEGALPNGSPMDSDTAYDYAHNANRTDSTSIIDDELFRRQETGQAFIFSGPMWLPLRHLAACSLESLTTLQVKVAAFDPKIDLRSYYTTFEETTKLMLKARESLRSLIIVFGESWERYKEYDQPDLCGTRRGRFKRWYRPRAIKMTAAYLNQLLAALNRFPFPRLGSIRFEEFHLLKTTTPNEAVVTQLAHTFQSIRKCSYPNATFTELSSVDGRDIFPGFDYVLNMEGFNSELLANSWVYSSL